MAQTRTIAITQVYLNNSNLPTSVTRTVEAVVVNNELVADIRSVNPGVINSAYTEYPTDGTGIETRAYP